MKKSLLINILLIIANATYAQTRTVHVFVALCDNENQGIIRVPEKLGNGQNPSSNLYWGAMYGVKSYFRYKSADWEYLKSYGQVDSTEGLYA